MNSIYIFFKYELGILNNLGMEMREIVSSLYSFAEDNPKDRKGFYDIYRDYLRIADYKMTLTLLGKIYWFFILEEAHLIAIRAIIYRGTLKE